MATRMCAQPVVNDVDGIAGGRCVATERVASWVWARIVVNASTLSWVCVGTTQTRTGSGCRNVAFSSTCGDAVACACRCERRRRFRPHGDYHGFRALELGVAGPWRTCVSCAGSRRAWLEATNLGSSNLNDQRECAVRTTWLEGYWTPPAATSRACACECSQRVGQKETLEPRHRARSRVEPDGC